MERLLGVGERRYFQSISVELGESSQDLDPPRGSCLNNKCKAIAMEHLKAFGLAACFAFIFFAWGGSLRSSCVNHNKKYGGDEEMRLHDCQTANNLFIIGSVFFAVIYIGYMVDICNRVCPDVGGD
jgi:hypothetical protein